MPFVPRLPHATHPLSCCIHPVSACGHARSAPPHPRCTSGSGPRWAGPASVLSTRGSCARQRARSCPCWCWGQGSGCCCSCGHAAQGVLGSAHPGPTRNWARPAHAHCKARTRFVGWPPSPW